MIEARRERLEPAYRKQAPAPQARAAIALVAAPAGSGKSVEIAERLGVWEGRSAHYSARPRDAKLVRFVRGLIDAIRPDVPALRCGYAAAAANARNTARPAQTLATWFVDRLGSAPAMLALDDLHAVEGEAEIEEFIVSAIERSQANVQWIIGVRSVAHLPVATWLASGRVDMRCDAGALRLEDRDAPDRVCALVRACEGHAGAVALALATDSIGTTAANYRARSTESAMAFVRSLQPDERSALVSLSLASSLDEGTVAEIPWAPEALRALRAALPCAVRRYHGYSRLDDAIAQAACGGIDDATRVRAGETLVGALERAGRPVEALRAAVDLNDAPAIAARLERDGFALLDGGYGDVIADAAARLTRELRSHSAISLLLAAEDEVVRGRHDVADAWFSHAAAAAGTPVARARIEVARARHALRRGERSAIDLLEAVVANPPSVALQAEASALLGAAYAHADRHSEAGDRIAAALALLGDVPDVVVRAGVYHRAAYVALQDGDAHAAERYAERSLAIADSHGLDEQAAVTLSVLYAIAIEHRDDARAATKALQRLEACAIRLDNADLRQYARLARFELVAESGDVAEIHELEKRLRGEELENSVLVASVTFDRVRALRRAWSGDFADAYRELLSTAERVSDAGYRAARWSEIALYAAAAEDDAFAYDAIERARDAFGAVAANVDASAVRFRVLLAVAAAMLGNLELARELLHLAKFDVADRPRRRVLLEVAAQMVARRAGEVDDDALLQGFAALHDADLGGIATMFGAIPSRRFASAPSDAA